MNTSIRFPKGVTLINPSTVMLQCDVCGQQWSPRLLEGGRLARKSKACPNGCTAKLRAQEQEQIRWKQLKSYAAELDTEVKEDETSASFFLAWHFTTQTFPRTLDGIEQAFTWLEKLEEEEYDV